MGPKGQGGVCCVCVLHVWLKVPEPSEVGDPNKSEPLGKIFSVLFDSMKEIHKQTEGNEKKKFFFSATEKEERGKRFQKKPHLHCGRNPLDKAHPISNLWRLVQGEVDQQCFCFDFAF